MPGRSSMLRGFRAGRQMLFSFHIADHGLGGTFGPFDRMDDGLGPGDHISSGVWNDNDRKLFFKLR